MSNVKNRKGFTLVELLVVIAIIGLLSTLAVISLNSAREKARDATRISDVRQLQTAMELWFDSNSQSYDLGATCEDQAVSGCTTLNAVASNIDQLNDPSFGTGADPLCSASQAENCNYAFGSTDVNTYIVHFFLETDTGGYAAGSHTLDETGLN